ncbi:MAG: tetratricopeptide repeat protein [Bacteroidetes bacterium]|nr:tetratricopeptide repeat protein [Bacteroidota bacterium]
MKYPLFIVCFLAYTFSFSQLKNTDSLYNIIKAGNQDTNVVNALFHLVDLFYDEGLEDSSLLYINKGFNLSDKLDYNSGKGYACYKKVMIMLNRGNLKEAQSEGRKAVEYYSLCGKKREIADSYNMCGVVADASGDYEKALEDFETALQIHTEIVNVKGLGAVYNNMGNLFDVQGNYVEATKYHLLSLKNCEKTRNKKGVARSYNSLASIAYSMGNMKSALEYNEKSIKICEELGDKKNLSYSYNNLANVYAEEKKFSQALKYYTLSLNLNKEGNRKKGVAICHTGIGNLYLNAGKCEEALKHHFASLEIKEEINDKPGIAVAYLNIGSSYRCLKKYGEAEAYCKKSIKMASEMGLRDCLSNANNILSVIYENTGKYSAALDAFKLYISQKDSLLNEENTEKTTRMEMNYEFDKKVMATKILQVKKEAVARSESNRQKIIIWSICAVLLLTVVFALYVYRNYLEKEKAHQAIRMQKEVIEEKQKEILDSIKYAKRIQTALLTNEKYIDRNIREMQNRSKI